MKIFLFSSIVLLFFSTTRAQETKTLFGSDIESSFAWGLDFKINSIQRKTGTLAGAYAGILIDRSTVVALTVGANIGHPVVNYGYLGLMTQYTLHPFDVFHFSGQLLIAAGSAKDYKKMKSSTMDDFGNTSGPGFWLVEPSVLGEINFSKETRFGFGLGYRIVSGLDENHLLISTSKVTNADLSGVTVMTNIKIALYD